MRKLIFIIGDSGSGKDTAANYLRDTYGWHKVASYTTRQIRDGEILGDNHIFMRWGASANDPKYWATVHGLHIFAQTYYGGNHYWTTQEQMIPDDNHPTLYIIDEKGFFDVMMDADRSKWLQKNFEWNVWIIQRHENQIMQTIIDDVRMMRDKERKDMRNKVMDFLGRIGKYPRIICNYYDIDYLYASLDAIAND